MHQDYSDIKKQIKKSNKLVYWLNDKGDVLIIKLVEYLDIKMVLFGSHVTI